MFVQLQDVMVTEEVIRFVCENSLYEYFCFVTDDVLPDILYRRGHVDAIMRKAIALGMRAEDAIYCTTYTPARRMNLTDRGTIAPGRLADFVLLDDLDALKIDSTFKKGICIYDRERPVEEKKEYSLDGLFEDTVHSRRLVPEDFRIPVEGPDRTVRARVMKVNPLNNRTDEVFIDMEVKDHELLWKQADCRLLMVIERHGRDNRIACGFTCGSDLKKGACASSYSHDSHNLIVMGNDEEDMRTAINRVIDMHGGICTVLDGKITSEVALPVAGLLSKKPVEECAMEFEKVREAFEAQGYEHLNSVMNFTLLSLTCIPVLKLTDRGYLNTETFRLESLYEEKKNS